MQGAGAGGGHRAQVITDTMGTQMGMRLSEEEEAKLEIGPQGDPRNLAQRCRCLGV